MVSQKKRQRIFVYKFVYKFKCITAIFVQQQCQRNAKLLVQQSPKASNSCCYFTLQNKTLAGCWYFIHHNMKMDKNAQLFFPEVEYGV